MATGSSASRVDASVATTRASSREPNAGIKPMTFLKYSLLAVHPYPSSLITSEGDVEALRRDTMSLPEGGDIFAPNREDSRIHTTSLSEWPLSKKNDESALRARARGRLRKILGERVLFHERLARVAPLVSAVPRELQAEVEREFLSQSQDVAERGEVRDFVPLVANLRRSTTSRASRSANRSGLERERRAATEARRTTCGSSRLRFKSGSTSASERRNTCSSARNEPSAP